MYLNGLNEGETFDFERLACICKVVISYLRKVLLLFNQKVFMYAEAPASKGDLLKQRVLSTLSILSKGCDIFSLWLCIPSIPSNCLVGASFFCSSLSSTQSGFDKVEMIFGSNIFEASSEVFCNSLSFFLQKCEKPNITITIHQI